MRALLVLPEPPLPQGRAAGRCALAMVEGLQQQSVDVRVLAARQHWAVPGEPPSWVPATVIDVPPEPPGWGTRLRRVRAPLGELGRGVFAAAVREAAMDADVIQLEEPQVAPSVRGIGVPSALDVHFRVLRDRAPWPPWTQDGRFAVEQAVAERAAIRSRRWLIASSPVVAAGLRRANPRADVSLVPLCLRTADHPVAPLDGPPLAGIIGTAAWHPTATAMRDLVGQVWPRVHRLVPQARLQVAGRGTASLFAGAALPPGVELLGEVPSSIAFLHTLSVLLYPLARGSGMKVKVLEAIACGVPVVTTPAGAEGIDAGDGVVVSEDPEELAAATARLLGDPGERRQRGAAARAAFLRNHTPRVAGELLAALYRRMAESR